MRFTLDFQQKNHVHIHIVHFNAERIFSTRTNGSYRYLNDCHCYYSSWSCESIFSCPCWLSGIAWKYEKPRRTPKKTLNICYVYMYVYKNWLFAMAQQWTKVVKKRSTFDDGNLSFMKMVSQFACLLCHLYGVIHTETMETQHSYTHSHAHTYIQKYTSNHAHICMHKHKHKHIGRAYIYFSIALRMDVNNSSSHRDWRAKVSIKRRLYLRFHDCYHTRIYADDIQCSCKLISSILFNMFASMLLAHTVCCWLIHGFGYALLCFVLLWLFAFATQMALIVANAVAIVACFSKIMSIFRPISIAIVVILFFRLICNLLVPFRSFFPHYLKSHLFYSLRLISIKSFGTEYKFRIIKFPRKKNM